MSNVYTLIGAVVLSFAGLLLLSFLLSYPVFLLWNGCFVGAIAGVNEITWLQAWGLSILFGMLFKPSGATSK
jgi:hypothetical protein